MLRVVTRHQRAGTARSEFKRGEDGGSHPNSLGLEHNVSPNTSPTGKKKMYYCQGITAELPAVLGAELEAKRQLQLGIVSN